MGILGPRTAGRGIFPNHLCEYAEPTIPRKLFLLKLYTQVLNGSLLGGNMPYMANVILRISLYGRVSWSPNSTERKCGLATCLLLVPDQIDRDEIFRTSLPSLAYHLSCGLSYRRKKRDIGLWVGHFYFPVDA